MNGAGPKHGSGPPGGHAGSAQLHGLFTAFWNTPSAGTLVTNAFGHVPQPKLGKGVCSAVGSGAAPTRGVEIESPATGADVVSTDTRHVIAGVRVNEYRPF